MTPARAATLALLCALVATPAIAGKKKKDKDAAEAPTEPVAAPAPPPPPPPVDGLFADPLPLDLELAVHGLANPSAQGCAACHYAASDGWARSAHGQGPSEAFRAAVAEVGTPACTVCHLPLLAQQADLVTYDNDDVNRPITTPNPQWRASLASEGVTCVACHLREGVLVGAVPPAPDASAPHGVAWSSELGQSALCGACHQLTWPEASTPMYDTYGEWERSPHAAAGIQCQDCHLGAAVDGQAPDHAMPAHHGRGVSVRVSLDRPTLTRGDTPTPIAIVLQNTGAGHAIPTGSPFRGLRLEAFLEGPPDRHGDPVRLPALVVDLARTLSPAPPYDVVADTRLSAGEERALEYAPVVDRGQPAGDWALRVTLTPTVRGEPAGEPRVMRTIPLVVE